MFLTRLLSVTLALAGPAARVSTPTFNSVRFFTQTDIRRWPGEGGTWKRATLELHFDVAPKVGQEVTVAPLGVPVAPFRMLIRGIEPHQFEACGGDKIETIYDVQIDDLPARSLLTLPAPPERRDEFPFDAAVIYPAVSRVRVLTPAQIPLAKLPRGVRVSDVTLALALTSESAPDLLIVTRDEGARTSEDYYQRYGSIWRQVKHLTPC